jgi:two-component system response regulator YesN
VLVQVETGFIVVGAHTNPKNAVGEIITEKPNVVISGLRMEHMDGITLMKTLKESGINLDFVILSRKWTTEDMRDFFHLGGFDYIRKPFDVKKAEDLLARLSDKSTPAKNTVAAPIRTSLRRYHHKGGAP